MMNRVFKFIIIIGGFLLVVLFGLQISAKVVVENFLTKKTPNHIHLNYDNVVVNIFTGKIRLNKIFVQITNQDNKDIYSELKVDHFTLNGLSFWQFFFKNKVSVRECILQTPIFEYFPHKRSEPKKEGKNAIVGLIKSIAVEKSLIENGSLKIFSKRDSILFNVERVNFELLGGTTNSTLISQKIPLRYENYSLTAQKLFFDLGDYEQLSIKAINIADYDAIFTDTHLYSKYNKVELSKRIKHERDHFLLEIPSMHLVNFDLGFLDNRMYFNSELNTIEDPHFEVYRDKNVPDDNSIKSMYGELLRKSPIDLKIDSVKIVNGLFRYEEKTRLDADEGFLFFDTVNIEIANLGNRYNNGEITSANIEALVMGTAPINLSYEFNVNVIDNSFMAQGSLTNLSTESVNTFLKPTVGITTSGVISELYFTVGGNELLASGDMKMKYSDFNFKIVRQNKSGINKALTTIGNWFINDGNNSDADGYRYGSISVERDDKKSVFNYIWLIVQDGIFSTVVGKSKK